MFWMDIVNVCPDKRIFIAIVKLWMDILIICADQRILIGQKWQITDSAQPLKEPSFMVGGRIDTVLNHCNWPTFHF